MGTRGRFIVLEGGEGTGKSTQAKRLAEDLGAVLTREPGGTIVGEQLRQLVLHSSPTPLDVRTELLLMVAARAQHLAEVINPALESGRDVVCDRFAGSTHAYQGYGRGIPLEDVDVACTLAANGVTADLNVLLEVHPDLAKARRPPATDRIEKAGESFHERVVDGFRSLAQAEPDKWVLIDGNGTELEVGDRVLAAVKAHFQRDEPARA